MSEEFISQDRTNGFPSLPGYDAWIEDVRTPDSAFELVISISIPSIARAKIKTGFWLEFTAPNGDFLGWIRFTHLINIKNQALFAGSEWRLASGPAPAQTDVLLPSLVPQKKGCGYDQVVGEQSL